MTSEGCWSTVVCSPAEREALGLTGQSEWLLACRLAAGHLGNHATDVSPHPRSDRRLWLEWNDFDDRAQSLIERNPCPIPSVHGAPCVFFHGHGGAHFYAPSNGHAPTVSAGRGGPERGQSGMSWVPPREERLPPAAGQHSPPRDPPPEQLQPPRQQPLQEGLDAETYRGGRRSTDAEPMPDAPAYRGRRHSDGANQRPPVDDSHFSAGIGVEQDSQVSGRPFVAQEEPGGNTASVGNAGPSGGGDVRVSDALNEVADALAKLADALRNK